MIVSMDDSFTAKQIYLWVKNKVTWTKVKLSKMSIVLFALRVEDMGSIRGSDSRRRTLTCSAAGGHSRGLPPTVPLCITPPQRPPPTPPPGHMLLSSMQPERGGGGERLGGRRESEIKKKRKWAAIESFPKISQQPFIDSLWVVCQGVYLFALHCVEPQQLYFTVGL